MVYTCKILVYLIQPKTSYKTRDLALCIRFQPSKGSFTSLVYLALKKHRLGVVRSSYKEIRLDFRNLTDIVPKGLAPLPCATQSSPVCRLTFIKARENQSMCLKCLIFLNVTQLYPLIQEERLERKKITTYKLCHCGETFLARSNSQKVCLVCRGLNNPYSVSINKNVPYD